MPGDVKDSIARALYAIYNMPASPLKDTILHEFAYADFTGTYDGHYEFDSTHYLNVAGPMYHTSVKGLIMSIRRDGTAPWADDWASGNYTNTTFPEIDSFVARHISSIRITNLPSSYYITLTTKRAYNTAALAEQFMYILNNPAHFTRANTYIGDGNSVLAEVLDDGIQLTFGNGCGGCPAGCLHGRNWKFKVKTYTDCSVEYLGTEPWSHPSYPWLHGQTCLRNGGPTMPVKFAQLATVQKGTGVIVQWRVHNEYGIESYVVERSIDGFNFTTFGRLPSTTEATETKDYEWLDKAPSPITYYRIRANDQDGSILYSKVARHKLDFDKRITIENPVKNRVLSFSDLEAGTYKFAFYTVEGQLLSGETIRIENGNSLQRLALPSSVTSGLYILRITDSDGVDLSKKLLVY